MPHQLLKSYLHVLMLSPQYRPIVGGYERAAERLSHGLASRGHRITVITERRSPKWSAREAQDGVQVKRLWCLYRRRLHAATSLMSFAFFLITRGREFHVWHVHQYGLHAALAVALGKLLYRPVVLKLTSTKSQGIHHSTDGSPVARLAGWLLRKVDAVVALSKETQDEARTFGIPESRIHLIGNGVSVDQFVPRGSADRKRLRKNLSIDAHGLVVAVGRLVEVKNFEGLLLAWKAARPHLPAGWKLVVVGDGPLRSRLLSTVEENGLSQSVSFVGQRHDVSDWLGAADIYALSSRIEGLSNTLLEAMAAGLPVVSTRVSGSIELLSETGAGLVVDIDDAEQFAKALVDLAVSTDQRTMMGAIGRSIIEGRYSLDAVSDRHERLYCSLLSRDRKGV